MKTKSGTRRLRAKTRAGKVETSVSAPAPPSRLLVASNRLPVVLERDSDGGWSLERGAGGLVTALEPVLSGRGGLWVGWPGVLGESVGRLEEAFEDEVRTPGYEVRPISLTEEEWEGFYVGFANRVIWPLFHDLLNLCEFDPSFGDAYLAVNRKVAKALADEAEPHDLVWVHDYHLMNVGAELRRQGVEGRVGFFLHIPFPGPDLFAALPWRDPILRGLLHYDLVGFQSTRDLNNFERTVRDLIPEASVRREGRRLEVEVGERRARAGVFPVSIDFSEFEELALSEAVEERVARYRGEAEGRDVILGVDRLDYSKGIPQKLRGFQIALRRFPELRGRVTLLQLVVPSREDVPEYAKMKRDIERLVGEIQGEFTAEGWAPIYYQYGTWDRPELVARYRSAKVALVTPLKDGMNLVAKEYFASKVDEAGTLVLSERAGVVDQLGDEALVVNPYDVEGVAQAIRDAVFMDEGERTERTRRAREAIRTHDSTWWTETFLAAAAEGSPL